MAVELQAVPAAGVPADQRPHAAQGLASPEAGPRASAANEPPAVSPGPSPAAMAIAAATAVSEAMGSATPGRWPNPPQAGVLVLPVPVPTPAPAPVPAAQPRVVVQELPHTAGTASSAAVLATTPPVLASSNHIVTILSIRDAPGVVPTASSGGEPHRRLRWVGWISHRVFHDRPGP